MLSDVSRRGIQRELQSRVQTVGGIPVRTPGTTPGAARGPQELSAAQRLLNREIARGIPLLGTLTTETDKSTKATERSTGAKKVDQAATVKQTAAQKALATARTAVLAAQLSPQGSAVQAQQAASAARALANAQALATQAGAQQLVNQAVLNAAGPLQVQISSLQAANQAIAQNTAALRKQEAASARAARGHEQIRRGALSTSLSFLGIRGATLAASASFLAGAAAIAVFAKAIQGATQFATQLNVFRATAGATANELEEVRNAARALGADITLPGVTAADAAESMSELAKAGLDVQDSIDGARGVLQLATAAAIDNAQAVELAANAINAFQLAGRDATHVADVFANAANAAQGSIVDIGIAFQQASAAGRQVGLSFEDTSLFLTVLARNGLRGSDAGTSLRTALLRLIKPTKAAKEELKSLGVETRDAAGNLRPDVFIQLTEATRNLSPAVRDAKLALIGGQDAFRAITILGRQSIESFIALRRELREQGTAAELAAARAQGLQGSIDALSNTLSTAGTRIGASFTPALQQIVGGITTTSAALAGSEDAATAFSGITDFLNTSLSALGTTLQALGPVILPIGSALAAVTNAVGVPTILAAVAAYKLLPIVFAAVRASLIALTASATSARFAMALLADPAITGKAAFFNVYALAATAAAAAVFFLATRETEAERVTRRLKEATEGLIETQERLNRARTEARDAPLQVNAAQLGVLEAQQAVGQARAKVAAAPTGTFARTKAELELAVAIDSVTIADNARTDAIQRSNTAQDIAAQAAKANEEALTAETTAIQENVDLIRERAASLFRVQPVGSDLELFAVQAVTLSLEKRAEAARKENTAESLALASRLDLLAQVNAAVKGLPDGVIDIAVTAPNLEVAGRQIQESLRATGQESSAVLVQSILLGLGVLPAKLKTYLDGGVRPGFLASVAQLGEDGGDTMATNFLAAFQLALKRSAGRSAGLARQEDLAVIASGATGARLPSLQGQLAEAGRKRATAEAEIARLEAAGKTKGLAAAREARTAAIAEQRQITEEIRGINDSLASEAESAARDAETTQNEIFQNILKAMGVRRDARQQAIEDAALTEGVADDLSANRRLRRLVNVQIARIQERINAARKQGKNVTELIAGLRILEGIYRELGRTVRELQKTRQEEIQARIAESNQLDIEFAQTTGNARAEIRARLREIARLKRLQALAKGDILERKRLRNLIADQQKAIDDLRKQNDERNRAFQELSFSFLTTQQGFAANLLGNLLPIGAIGNTVAGNLAARGGGGGVGGGGGGAGAGNLAGLGGNIGGLPAGIARGDAGRASLLVSAAAAEAGTIPGPTRGQASTEIELLRQILRTLRQQRERDKHPSSKKSEKRNESLPHGIGGV